MKVMFKWGGVYKIEEAKAINDYIFSTVNNYVSRLQFKHCWNKEIE